MAPYVPDGIPWPKTGELNPEQVGDYNRALSMYVHVPFCRVRCGYCDFNTYTVGFGPGAERATYDQSVEREIRLAARVLKPFPHDPIQSVFFGGGTPTLLSAAQITRILSVIHEFFEVAADAEVTVEANPDTVDQQTLARLASGGVTRMSFGMQSAVPRILKTLDRTHDPAVLPDVVKWAQEAGMDASVDLIYGTPGESIADWEQSLEAAVALNPDHISAYALVIEEGTKMWADVKHGKLPMPDPDDEATKYEVADRVLSDAGYAWYEISNWARLAPGEVAGSTKLRHASRHNLAYWKDSDWWGIGPGAHSHVGNLRWWNRKHPRAWADALADGSPAQAGEVLDHADRQLETVMLEIRTADGISVAQLEPEVRERVGGLVKEGLLQRQAALEGQVKLTLRGRLMADYVTRELT